MHRATTLLLAALAALALVLVPLPPATLALTRPAMPSDYDGDGYADLAIGVPGEGPGHPGAVNVLYGSATGLTAAGDQYWSKSSPGVKGTAGASDNFGWVLASGDFDRDGHADLAIGSGDRATNTRPGSVNVLYGSASGLTAIGDQLWTPINLPDGVADICVGYALAAGDFDGDGYWDLAIGGRGADQAALGGYVIGVTILYGSPAGLTTNRATVVPSAPPLTGDSWGLALAAGDLNGDGLADLAIGDPTSQTREPGHCLYACGVVVIHPGSAQGLSATPDSVWDLERVGWSAEWDDFGRTLAIGDFNGDGAGDLAIGIPGLPVGDELADEGAIAVLLGSPAGLTDDGRRLIHQDTDGVPGTGKAFDRFGWALATSDFDGDGYADLAVGVPGAGDLDSGAVVALYGGSTSIFTSGAQRWTQASSGVPGAPERGDAFGYALASADYGRSGHADLAIGVEGETIRGLAAGMVNVLYGRSSGLSGVGAQGWSQNSTGVKGTVQGGDGFGWSLTP